MEDAKRSVEISHDDSKWHGQVLELANSFESEKTIEASETPTGMSIVAMREEERKYFQKARECLAPGSIFRRVVHFYAERKLMVFFWIHLASTLVVWAHYALIKFEEQTVIVPHGAPHYWWKTLGPSLEFGR